MQENRLTKIKCRKKRLETKISPTVTNLYILKLITLKR